MITVLLPTYNAATILRKSIQSTLCQSFREFELIVLDDGSTDDTELLMGRIHDRRIRYIKLPHHGISETLNTGLKLASYDIIARMDAGDLSFSDRLEVQYSYFKNATENTILGSNYLVFEGSSVQYVVFSESEHRVIKKRLALHPDFPHSGVMYRKSFIIEQGGYRNVPIEDYDLWLRIKTIAQFHILRKVLMAIEYTEKRLSTSDVAQKYRDHYHLQTPYFVDMKKEFGYDDESEVRCIRGWREYFYGVKADARRYWINEKREMLFSPRIWIAWIITYFPENIFTKVKESRLRFRVHYLLHYFGSRNILIRRQFQSLLGKQ